jgi:hypothetical protein
METWFLIRSGPGAPAYNMALDEALLESVPRLGLPVLRFYSWTEPAATFGYLQNYSQAAALTRLRPLVRRPTVLCRTTRTGLTAWFFRRNITGTGSRRRKVTGACTNGWAQPSRA